MDPEFILIEFNREISFLRDLISKKAQASREEIQDLLEILERLERLRSRFLERF